MKPSSVLIIEDDEHDAFFLRRALETFSPAPILRQAITLEQAGNLLDERISELVLLDLNLPANGDRGARKASNEELVRFVRKFSTKCKIVVVTASDDDQHMAQLQKAGVESWWDKAMLLDPESIKSEIEGINIITISTTDSEKLNIMLADQVKLRRVIPLTRLQSTHIQQLVAVTKLLTASSKVNASNIAESAVEIKMLASTVKDLAILVASPVESETYKRGVADEVQRVADRRAQNNLNKKAAFAGGVVAVWGVVYEFGQALWAFFKAMVR
jgi:CheY-like chemotaxis protein